MTKTYGTITWEAHPGQWRVAATPDVITRIKRIFTRASAARAGQIVLAGTQENARDLEWVLQRWAMEVTPQAQERISGGAQAHRARGEAVTRVLSGDRELEALPLEPARPPRSYQRQAHDLLSTTGSLLLADDLGLGKTFSALLALSDPKNRPMLVVTLTGLERQWVRELGLTFPGLRAAVVKKGSPYPLADKDGQDPDMIVMNYAKMAGWADHLAGHVQTVIFDEVQELRREGSQKHAAACRLAEQAHLRAGLSATPVYNFGGEMYSILQVLSPTLVGDRQEFAREWCVTDYGGLSPKTRITDPDAFRAWMTEQGVFLRRTRSDVGITLPPLTTTEQFLEIDDDVWRREAGNALELAQLILNQDTEHRTRWKATGEFDWRMRQATGLAKAPAVVNFVRLLLESEDKIIVLAWHRAVWDILSEQLAEYRPALYSGSESAAQKARAYDDFVNGDSRVMMLSLRSGAGMDGLQDVTQTVVFAELDWSPGVHKQAVGRVQRPGQELPMSAYFCVADYGSDPVMLDTLDIKKMEADRLINPQLDTLEREPEAPGAGIRAVARQILAAAADGGRGKPPQTPGPALAGSTAR